MTLKLALFSMLGMLAACATTHSGQYATSLTGKLPLKISAVTIGDSENTPFQMVELTLENVGDDWVRINSSEVVFNDLAKSKVSVVVGQDLIDWATAAEAKRQQQQHNTALIQAGLIAAGTVAAAAGANNGDDGLTKLGAAAALGGYGWAATDFVRDKQRAVNGVRKVPDTHLYSPMAIPGKLFVRRWVLINKPSNMILKNLVVGFETVDGVKDMYEVKM